MADAGVKKEQVAVVKRSSGGKQSAKVETPTYYYATGRRKTSAARVFLSPGKKEGLRINGRSLESYVPSLGQRAILLSPFEVTEQKGADFGTYITVRGGGPGGQVGAIRHALSRALVKWNGELKTPLKKAGFLTRDARMVERKKYGQHKARKSTQYSKR